MYLAIIVLPLLGSIASGFFGRKVGITGGQLITSISVILTTFLALIAFLEVGLNNVPVSLELFRWLDSESLIVSWGFRFDSLTVSMLIPVLIVSSLVHVYSVGYMSHDPHNQRFFSYLSLFTFMMIILVTANNFLLMFVGWEGVGICSYLLVSFWFTRIAANQSSVSAFLTNRVGDCFLTIGMFAILWSFGNIDYSTVFSLAPYVNENLVTIIGVCLLIGAMAKSSQIGLHVWLPMAMEGWCNRAFLKLHYMREHPALILGPLKRYFLLGKIQEQGQSAGNCITSQSTLTKDIGSSETTREAFILKDNVFKYWFIGFTEGDGSFIINKNGYLEFKITQSSSDAQILFFIKKNLGFGLVRLQDKNNKTHCFRVRDEQGLFKIISIFNGNIFMETRKIQFNLFINAYNQVYNKNIIYIDSNFKPNLSNSWLCGFTDAEGCFICSIMDRSQDGGLVRLKYILSQKGNFEQMQYLAHLLNGKTHYLKSYHGYNMTVNTTKLSLVIKYFYAYPLKSKKNIVYFNWHKMYKLVMDKKHLTEVGLITIKRYNKNLNRLDKINKIK